MKLYDLEAFICNKRPDAVTPKEEVVLNDVKFKVILDENIIPPLEALEDKADRELVLARQRVIAQKQVEHPSIQAQIQETLVEGGRNDASIDDASERPPDVEYEDQGVLPEGAFLFRDHVAFLHVDKHGCIQQIDLVKKKAKFINQGPPVNREFTKMLIQDVKEHEWDVLVGHFMKNG